MQKPELTLDAAQKLVASALALAGQANTAIAVVVTDMAGHIIAAARMDGVSFQAIAFATRKAATSAAFKAPLGALVSMVSRDEITLRALSASADLLLLPGATPIMSGATCVGVIGIAGLHHADDQRIADQVAAQF